MKKRDTAAVRKSITRPEAYGLLFRHEYDVQPGYGVTADIISSVTKWTEPVKPRKGVVRKPARKKA